MKEEIRNQILDLWYEYRNYLQQKGYSLYQMEDVASLVDFMNFIENKKIN